MLPPFLGKVGFEIISKLDSYFLMTVRAALSCLGPFVITIIPPKILFTTAQLISASCISILGVFAYWNNYYTIDSGLAWIPLAAIILIFITR